jgi:transposase
MLRDLSVGEYSVVLHLTVRKFYCRNKKCHRKIFVEQPGKEVSSHARMTQRTKHKLEKILIETSANKGALLSRFINTPVSPSTALRIVRSIPMDPCGPIRTLGIDDWAYRKGISYGTILVDMEHGRVIDLLSGRDGVEVKRFLKSHREVEAVCRDRSSAYSAAVSEILPAANQIADRFHLVKNLSDAVYEVVRAEYPALSRLWKTPAPPNLNQKQKLPSQKQVKGEPSEYRKKVFFEVKKLLAEGMGYRTISKLLGISRTTVHKYADLDTPPIKSIPLKNDYSSYLQVIEQELSKGSTLKATYQLIVARGFKGGRSAFFEQFKDHPLRQTSESTRFSAASKISKGIVSLSPRKISIYLSLSGFDKIQNETEKAQMKQLVKTNAFIKKLRKQVQQFKEILKDGTPALLDQWMEATLLLKKKKLNTFVNGLKRDIQAVYNSITSTWSSGKVEGNVNRLKNIKRQMYGRASLELLKRKVILSCTG